MRHPFILEGVPLIIKVGTSSSYAGHAAHIDSTTNRSQSCCQANRAPGCLVVQGTGSVKPGFSDGFKLGFGVGGHRMGSFHPVSFLIYIICLERLEI
jgi:hypothetical protein